MFQAKRSSPPRPIADITGTWMSMKSMKESGRLFGHKPRKYKRLETRDGAYAHMQQDFFGICIFRLLSAVVLNLGCSGNWRCRALYHA